MLGFWLTSQERKNLKSIMDELGFADRADWVRKHIEDDMVKVRAARRTPAPSQARRQHRSAA